MINRLLFLIILLQSFRSISQVDSLTYSNDSISDAKVIGKEVPNGRVLPDSINYFEKNNYVYIEFLGVGLSATANYLRKISIAKNTGILVGIGLGDFVGTYELFAPLIPVRLLVYHHFRRSLITGGVDIASFAMYKNDYTPSRDFDRFEQWGLFEVDYQYHFSKRWYGGIGIIQSFYDSTGDFSLWPPFGHLQAGYKF